MDLPDHGVLSLLAAVGLAAVHIFSQQLRILDGIPRNRLLSAGGGLAVAFVAVRLPSDETLNASASTPPPKLVKTPEERRAERGEVVAHVATVPCFPRLARKRCCGWDTNRRADRRKGLTNCPADTQPLSPINSSNCTLKIPAIVTRQTALLDDVLLLRLRSRRGNGGTAWSWSSRSSRGWSPHRRACRCAGLRHHMAL